MGLLDGRVAVITGGSRGLGLGIARAYAREGAAVVIGSRSKESVQRATALLRSEGAAAVGVATDVGDRSQVEALAELAVQSLGRLDIWVNNAGISGPYGPTHLVPNDRFADVVQTNIMGTYHGSMVALKHFLPQGTGKLINMLGFGDRSPAPLQNVYGSSKAWVRNFTLALAKEQQRSGVGIFLLNPGMVTTEMLVRPEVVSGFESKLTVLPTIIRMWANPPDVPAERALWLASPATDGKSGLEVQVLGKPQMLAGAVREGMRRLFRRSAEAIDIRANSIK